MIEGQATLCIRASTGGSNLAGRRPVLGSRCRTPSLSHFSFSRLRAIEMQKSSGTSGGWTPKSSFSDHRLCRGSTCPCRLTGHTSDYLGGARELTGGNRHLIFHVYLQSANLPHLLCGGYVVQKDGIHVSFCSVGGARGKPTKLNVRFQ